MPEIEPLAQALQQTAQASAEPFLVKLVERAKALGLTDFHARDELTRMKAFLASYYEGIEPVSSFKDGQGQIIDCIPFDQQPTARAARKAGQPLLQMAPLPAGRAGSAKVQAMTANSHQTTESPCPPGTVMIRRLTLDDLIHFGTLDNFFQKNQMA